jgi:hypothetical protein
MKSSLFLPFAVSIMALSVQAGPSASAQPKSPSPADPYASQAPEPPIGPASAPHTAKDYDALAKLPDWGGIWVYNFGPPGPPPVLTPTFQAKVDAAKAAQAAGKDSPRPSNCLPPGMPQIMAQPYNIEFLFTPGKVTVIQEAYMQVRRIFTDGRTHPDGVEDSFMGHSIGHWEGDTLVVDTVALKATTMLSLTTPHSDKLHIVERIHQTGPQTLVDDLTFDDADALAQPWHETMTYTRHREWDQLEFICEENNRNPVDDTGKTHFILRDDPNAQ